ncbi:MAG: hypothetical protein S4CHLAM102_02530 [Chlamydiia bacterium]|nr:hypothetical protein [Chlamydiia bacterium]
MFELHTFADLNPLTSQQIRHEYGGKALGLYEAEQAQIEVPPVYLVGSNVHEAFMQQDPPDEIETFTELATQFVEENILFRALDGELFAVRSSSQDEDSSSKSFAGIFETRLNVPRDQLPEAIAYVWSSFLLEKAKSYQAKDHRMGVIIQPMIEAKFSGICFTRHPSPANVFENKQLIIEYAPVVGEKVVGGEVIPQRIIGSSDTISRASEHGWTDELLDAIFKLKKHVHHDADIEFVIDHQERFWLLQQRPISQIYNSNRLDLTGYTRHYKRILPPLDIELFIDGCCRYLPSYLELSIGLDEWMVMVSNNQGTQELWVHDILNQALVQGVSEKIKEDESYLDRIHRRYMHHFEQLQQAPPSDLFSWFEWITPLSAHYYVPMVIVEALHETILREIRSIDPQNAEHDLFELSTKGVRSLIDQLDHLLSALKDRPYEECADDLADIAHKFGFLNCRMPYDEPYSPKDLFDMISTAQMPPPPPPLDTTKYFSKPHLKKRLDDLREWIRIRNQEMECFYASYQRARPLIESTCDTLGITQKEFWQSPKSSLLQNQPNPLPAPTIFQSRGQTQVTDQVEVTYPQATSTEGLKGQTVYGKGKLKGKVHLLFSPDDFKTPPPRPCILVTGMTTPDFVPLLRKHYDAIITDEGGILCHAAIIAREIPIPSLVGTGIASDCLKDGMEIEIDFDRGIVLFD